MEVINISEKGSVVAVGLRKIKQFPPPFQLHQNLPQCLLRFFSIQQLDFQDFMQIIANLVIILTNFIYIWRIQSPNS